jgi:2-hydroxy-3-keto-5-methylthiopentenyl-1-phosphate phosphatase
MYPHKGSTKLQIFDQNVMKIPTIVIGICVSPSELQCTTSKQEETTHINSHQSKVKKTQFVKSLNEVKYKILLIGDSHSRIRAHLLQDNLNSDFKVSSFVKPGARLNEVINTVREELKTLNSDLVVVWGGVNDIRKNNTKEALNSVSKVVNENKELNVMLI